ncbi:MAG: hypothetical protein JWP38_3726 [Herbaspirillum sp.]|nr:hypothetical protein [Herbaspirillum sp.]
MKFAQQYSRATHSSDLRCDEHHGDTDKLAAAALSSELGASLFRVKFGNDATTYAALLAKWSELVVKKSIHREWPKHVTAHKVAVASLDYWLNDVCPACSGKAYEPLASAPNVLSDMQCKACKGQGKRPLVCEHRARDFVADMVEELEDMARTAGNNAMRKLASDMDFV